MRRCVAAARCGRLFARQKGADDAAVVELARRLAADEELAPFAEVPGAGAAGGLGAAFAALGAELVRAQRSSSTRSIQRAARRRRPRRDGRGHRRPDDGGGQGAGGGRASRGWRPRCCVRRLRRRVEEPFPAPRRSRSRATGAGARGSAGARTPARDAPARRGALSFFDLALRRVEPLAAERVELLAALPQRERLVERRLALLQPLDDLLELGLRLLEGLLLLAHSTSSTRAPKPPSASCTSTRTPGATSAAATTTRVSVRTIA